MIRSQYSLPILVALAALPGCSESERPPDVVILTVDTLRADRVGCYGNDRPARSPTPVADRLAAEGVRFERAYAPRGSTHPSLASMLTGKYPITHGLRQNGQPLDSREVPFPVLFKRAGYRTAAFAANLDRSRWPFWVRGFDVAEDGIDGRLLEEGFEQEFRFQSEWDERVVDKAVRWIHALPDDDAPFLLWVHLYDAHGPYTPDPELQALYQDPAYDGPLRHPTGAPGEPARDAVSPQIAAWTLGDRPLDDSNLQQVRALYDAGVAGADDRLARVLDALAERDRLDDALLIYASDHGEELADHHRYFGHGNSIYDSVLRIPLIVSWPGRIEGGKVADALAMNLDLFPTLLDAIGAPVPPGTEGKSLLPLLLGDAAAPLARRFVFSEWEDLIYAVSDGEWKYIHNPRGARPRNPPYHLRERAAFPYLCHELYHVREDPLEQNNLFSRTHDRARELRGALDSFLREPAHQGSMRLPEQADEGLAAIGYLGSTQNRNIITIDCEDQ